jgi:hypothetical protein
MEFYKALALMQDGRKVMCQEWVNPNWLYIHNTSNYPCGTKAMLQTSDYGVQYLLSTEDHWSNCWVEVK